MQLKNAATWQLCASVHKFSTSTSSITKPLQVGLPLVQQGQGGVEGDDEGHRHVQGQEGAEGLHHVQGEVLLVVFSLARFIVVT